MRQAGTRLRALIAAGFGVFLSLTAAQALDRGRLATQSDVAALPASAVHNPFEGDASVLPEGRSLFNQYCSHCHAPNAINPDPSRDLLLSPGSRDATGSHRTDATCSATSRGQ